MARSGVYEAEVAQGVVIASVFMVYLTFTRHRATLTTPPAQVTIPTPYLCASLGPISRKAF